MTDFIYNAIIPERREWRLFFVQDKETMKWGALRTMWQSTNAKPRDKIGILTDWGYSKILYDRYDTNDADCSFRLIRNDRKRARRMGHKTKRYHECNTLNG